MSHIQIETAFNIDLEFEIAPFHRRLLAYLIDFSIISVYLIAMKSFFYQLLDVRINENMGLDILLISLPMLLYSLLAEINMNGQTLGKKLMKIRVISADGGEPALSQYLLRWITKSFEWPFLFGYVMFFNYEMVLVYAFITGILGLGVVIIIAVTPKSQRLGDLAAGTVVVKANTEFSIEDTVFMQVVNADYKPLFPQVMRLTDNDINTVKAVLTRAKNRKEDELSIRVQHKIKEVLGIDSDMPAPAFLQKLLEDYNYLATKE
ncbi:MAG: RDD family protein [Ferruginibacter sp.]